MSTLIDDIITSLSSDLIVEGIKLFVSSALVILTLKKNSKA